MASEPADASVKLSAAVAREPIKCGTNDENNDQIVSVNDNANDLTHDDARLCDSVNGAELPSVEGASTLQSHKPSLPARARIVVTNTYARTPGLRRLPGSAASAIGVLILVNCVVWIVAAVVLRFYRHLSGVTILAWTLGLRHALDADHISAIDLMTRRLLALERHSVLVGTFFSLGHSTVILVTCIAVAATSAAISEKFSRFSYIGGIVGNSVSAAFLLLLGGANAWVLFRLVQQMRGLLAPTRDRQQRDSAKPPEMYRGGCMYVLLVKVFGFVDRPWKMYPLGVLFGLGFDTSSQVALLGISSLQSEQGTSLWLLLLLPIVFAAGMCLLDTADGALMYALYAGAMGLDGGASIGEKNGSDAATDTVKKDGINIVQHSIDETPETKNVAAEPSSMKTKPVYPGTATPSGRHSNLPTTLYYSVILTGLTVLIAVIIGVIQLLTLIQSVSNVDGPFWNGVTSANDHYDIIGAAICGAFIVAAVLSVVFHSRWIALVERRQAEDPGEDA